MCINQRPRDIIIIISFCIPTVVKVPRVKTKDKNNRLGWKGLEFVLTGSVGKGVLDVDRIVALNKNWQALEQEGGLADIICDLCNTPSQVAKEFKSVAVDGFLWFPRQLEQKHRSALVERIWLFFLFAAASAAAPAVRDVLWR